jgi:predicted glycosyltransferase
MKIGIFANTPAQVHFYGNIIKELRKRGHETFLLARDYGETLDLLKESNTPHYLFSKPPASKYGKVGKFPLDVLKAFAYLKKCDVDFVTGFGAYDAYTSALLRVPSIVFTDSEFTVNAKSYTIQYKLSEPLIDAVITPEAFKQDLGPKQIRVKSYKELAYLHPNYYNPTDSIHELLGIPEGEDYTVLRFNAFDAVHDLGINGFDNNAKIQLVNTLKEYGHVFVSAEGPVPAELESYVLKAPKRRIHDILYYAKLLVTDTQTMATEAALLGIPTIRCNKFVGSNDMSNFTELEQKYHLMYNFNTATDSIHKATELIQLDGLKKEWEVKRKKLLAEKVDITEYMVSFFENYPETVNV